MIKKHFNKIMWGISFIFLACSYYQESLVDIVVWLAMMWYWYDLDKITHLKKALHKEEKDGR